MTELGIRSLMSRREFVTRSAAALPLFWCGGGGVFTLLSPGQKAETPPEKHKFLRDAGLSYSEVFQMAIGRLFIPAMQAVEAKFGIDAVQEAVFEGIRKRVETFAQTLPNREFPAFAQFFKSPDPFTANTWTMAIVEDTDRVFEMRFDECLWAKTFKEAKAEDLGFKLVCLGDFVTAEAFNPKIELVRDKTLMQGHDCCNHKYVVKS